MKNIFNVQLLQCLIVSISYLVIVNNAEDSLFWIVLKVSFCCCAQQAGVLCTRRPSWLRFTCIQRSEHCQQSEGSAQLDEKSEVWGLHDVAEYYLIKLGDLVRCFYLSFLKILLFNIISDVIMINIPH